MRFSERIGFKPIKNIIQIDSMDTELRNSLWNALVTFYWGQIPINTRFDYFKREKYLSQLHDGKDEFASLILKLWGNYFKHSLHELPQFWKTRSPSRVSEVYGEIQSYFFNCEWYEVYDFVEFIPENYYSYHYRDRNEKFIEYCNAIMKRELSGYRFVDGKIARITSEEEIISVEEAIDVGDQFKPVSLHIKQALDLFADRKSPDYRNSIKESISAVEAMCKLISGDERATLATALRKLEDKVAIHPALKKAFDSLYGYTSDEGGIRHALLEESDLKFEDAQFMLVTCSAFINYLKAKLP